MQFSVHNIHEPVLVIIVLLTLSMSMFVFERLRVLTDESEVLAMSQKIILHLLVRRKKISGDMYQL